MSWRARIRMIVEIACLLALCIAVIIGGFLGVRNSS